MADDLLSSLVSGDPQSADKVAAIVQQLRSKGQLADLAQMSGDPTLSPFGAHQNQMIQQNEVELGRNAMQNRRDDIQQQQVDRQLNQGQATLAETIRYHNMEDQEKKDKLAQQKELNDYVAGSQSTIDAIGQYKVPPPSLSRSPKSIALMDALTQQYPNYDASVWQAKKDAQVDFAKGPSSNLVKGADVAVQHLDTADQLATGLHNTSNHAVNTLVNWYKTQTGDPEIAKFNAAKSIVSDEIEKFIIGGGTGAGALADRQQLQSQLSDANSPQQLQEVTNTLRTLMGGQLKGLQSKFVNAGLGSPDDFLKRLDPRTVGSLGFAPSQPGPGTAGGDGGQPPTSALPSATAAAQGTPGPGSGPPQGPAPSPIPKLPIQGASMAPGALPGAISPAEAQLRGTGYLSDGTPAPKSAIVDNNGIVRTGRRNGKRVGQLADGTIVPLE